MLLGLMRTSFRRFGRLSVASWLERVNSSEGVSRGVDIASFIDC